MDDVNDGSKIDTPRRIEVLTGAERRRQWSDEAKARIVAESLVPDAVVSKIARRHDVLPSQIYAWRKLARGGAVSRSDAPAFAPVEVIRPAPPPKSRSQRPIMGSMIEIEAGAVIVRISGSSEPAVIEGIIRALKG